MDKWSSGRKSGGSGRNNILGVQDVFLRPSSVSSPRSERIDDDEEALKWAAVEKLPTYNRLRTSILFQSFSENYEDDDQKRIIPKEIDVRKLGTVERHNFIEKIFKMEEEDNEKFQRSLRARIDRVGIKLPTVEVRFENLNVDAEYIVSGRALPTLWNSARNFAVSLLDMVGLSPTKKTVRTILKDATCILKPFRMTLLLGPPGPGKTELLLALAGKLGKDLKVKGSITYNGCTLEEFVPQKTAAYISQHDLHVGMMTVGETLDFSARCQGVGSRYELLSELTRREKEAGIFPEAEVDLFTKATAVEGIQSSLQTDYTLKAISGVPKIEDKCNPATWMLEASSIAVEHHLGIDFAEYYKSSPLYQRNKILVKELSVPASGVKDLCFATQYSQPFIEQFKSCLWKQWLTYWRSPDYNSVRFIFTIVIALIFGTIFWNIGSTWENNTDLFAMIGAMIAAVLFLGINNCSTVQPVVAIERTVFYRERAAGMYSAVPYALAQVAIEIPYTLLQTIVYVLIAYSMIGFQWTARKFCWFMFINFFTFLYFTYYGMMAVAITPNHQVASIVAAAFYSIFNLFSGFFIPRPKIPKWWIWYYWICPVAWTVYGLIASQYGDITGPLQVLGEGEKPLNQYLDDYFGYKHDFLGAVAGVLVGFSVFFAFVFAFCIKVLNFQQR